ncbi:MAG: glyoxalase/bleomycin resistance/dioxygenase family protein [Rhodospirillales bacterium]|nr:glyoxalase/bleomycin resistance/dioxygenase family protein [Rhodospirillales bacterium]
MKRFHVHVAVNDLGEAIRFYADLFAASPDVHKPDYAKWMLDDPRVNFAISARGRKPGLDHFGIQAENGEELVAVHDRLEGAGRALLDKGEAACCYARSEKAWVVDPEGIAWETFFTKGEATTYGADLGPADTAVEDAASEKAGSACCSQAGKPADAVVAAVATTPVKAEAGCCIGTGC